MQQTAISWLIYRLTGSPFLLGIASFLEQVPSAFLTSFGGVLADRFDRKKILFITQALFMVQATILSILVSFDLIEVWHIMVLGTWLGILFAFDIPNRQSLTIDMLDNRADLGNAIALSSSMFNAARLAGPAIAGFLIVAAGEKICFMINAASYIPVLICIKILNIKRNPTSEPKHIIDELKEGVKYAYNSLPIRRILTLLGIVSLFGIPLQVLMPVYARDIFGGGPQTLGFLMGVFGFGALLGALFLAARKNVLGLIKMIGWSAALYSLAVMSFAFLKSLSAATVFLMIGGFAIMCNMAACNTVLQTIVDENKRGRLMGLYTLSFFGSMPFGSLMSGWIATKIGAPLTLFICTSLSLIAAFVFIKKLPDMRQLVRAVYIKKGILPHGAGGLPSAIPE